MSVIKLVTHLNKGINSSLSTIQPVLLVVTSTVICPTLLYIHAITFLTLQNNSFNPIHWYIHGFLFWLCVVNSVNNISCNIYKNGKFHFQGVKQTIGIWKDSECIQWIIANKSAAVKNSATSLQHGSSA
jgi:hypothetical protein